MKLKIKERVYLGQMIPKTGNILDMMIVKGIVNKLDFTAKEIQDNEIAFNNGTMSWKKDSEVDIELIQPEIKVIKDAIDKLDKENGITLDNLELCLKFKNL